MYTLKNRQLQKVLIIGPIGGPFFGPFLNSGAIVATKPVLVHDWFQGSRHFFDPMGHCWFTAGSIPILSSFSLHEHWSYEPGILFWTQPVFDGSSLADGSLEFENEWIPQFFSCREHNCLPSGNIFHSWMTILQKSSFLIGKFSKSSNSMGSFHAFYGILRMKLLVYWRVPGRVPVSSPVVWWLGIPNTRKKTPTHQSTSCCFQRH